MTPEKYEELKRKIDGLLPARAWLTPKMLAAPKEVTSLDITFKAPHTVYLSPEVEIDGPGIIYGNVTIAGNSFIGHHCVLSHNVYIEDSDLGNRVYVGPNAQIIRSAIGYGTDIPHHCYIGDATIGRYCNIGDAVTTSNFDGIRKHQTIIEDGCFIGTQMKIVPPVKIGRESYVAVRELKRDIPPHSFVVQGVVDGRLTEIIKENRSFMLMPGKWLFTKKPITPELMYAFRERMNSLFESKQDAMWEFFKTPKIFFNQKTPLDILKSDGDEGVRQLIDLVGRLEWGIFT